MKKTSSYHDALLVSLRNPDEAKEYLNAALEDSREAFLKALKNVAQAIGIGKVAKEAGVQRETLYRSLSVSGNPTIDTLSSVLTAVGLKLAVESDSRVAEAGITNSRNLGSLGFLMEAEAFAADMEYTENSIGMREIGPDLLRGAMLGSGGNFVNYAESGS